MGRSQHRIWWVALLVLTSPLLSRNLISQEARETQRSYLQAAMGYYSPSDGWETYKKHRTEMNQPLKYSESEFKRLPISDIDSLAREAKKTNAMYQRYAAAMDTIGLQKLSKGDFWKLSWRDADAAMLAAEDTSQKWPEYKENMARMGLEYKAAQVFFELTSADRTSALADSRGTGRAWHQAIRGYYTAADGWKTYKECRIAMDVGLQYTEYDFMHLAVGEIDRLAREAKRAYDLHQRYATAADSIGVKTVSKKEFWKLSASDEVVLVEATEDTAQKWPEYKENMARMGLEYKAAQQFLDLSPDDRANLYAASCGTSRSAWQVVTGNYSAKGGWATYTESLAALGMQPEYKEYDFINLRAAEINRLASHAKAALDIYGKFKSVCEQAEKPLLYRPEEVYKKDDLKQLQQEYTERYKAWASRIVYANACKRVGVPPNWSAFESKSTAEQDEAALLAATIADKWAVYAAVCDKLGVSPDKAFVSHAPGEQDDLITQLKDELWDQRKEAVGEIAQGVGEVALAVGIAILAQKAGGSGPTQKAAVGPRAPRAPKVSPAPKSKIDREMFGKQRQDYWKSEAQKNTQGYSADNVKRMKQGKSPIGADGYPIELHHPDGSPNAAPVPMTRTDHRVGDNYQRNHPWLFEKK